MAVDPVSWMIGGPDKDTLGPKHSAEIVRQAHHDATGGAEGVSSVGGLRVAALDVPGAAVRVLPGGATLLNRYQRGEGQSYGVRNASQTEVAITATGSGGGRTDLVVIRVLDPQYEGQYPLDPDDFQYTRLEVIEGVPAGTKRFKELNRNYPAIELARIDLPKSTATVTYAMITDLREVAQPKRREVIRARASVTADGETLTVESVDGEWFPNAGAKQDIHVPEWATRMINEASWLQVREQDGNSWGECWVEWGPYERPSTRKYSTQRFNWDSSHAMGVSRTNWEVADDRYVNADIRGTDQLFIMKGRVLGKVSADARPKIDAKSGVKLRVTFLEVADMSTS